MLSDLRSLEVGSVIDVKERYVVTLKEVNRRATGEQGSKAGIARLSSICPEHSWATA